MAASGAGLAFGWAWTGFPREELWDWLHLMLFPIVLVLLPEWIRRGEPIERRHWIGGAMVAAVFALLLLGGYRWGWSWTGFTGNSFRDWLNLLIAPFLLPVAAKGVYAHQSARRSRTSQAGPGGRVISLTLPAGGPEQPAVRAGHSGG